MVLQNEVKMWHQEISSCSSSLNSDKRDYQQQCFNNSHSTRYLNTVCTMSVILTIKHLNFTCITTTGTKPLDFINHVVPLDMGNFILDITVKWNFIYIVKHSKFTIWIQEAFKFLQTTFQNLFTYFPSIWKMENDLFKLFFSMLLLLTLVSKPKKNFYYLIQILRTHYFLILNC